MKKQLHLFILSLISSFSALAQCDSVSILNVYYYEDDMQERTTVKYNSAGAIQYSECYRQDPYGIWKPYIRTDYTYDANDSLLLQESKSFRNGAWETNSRLENMFTPGGQRQYTSLSSSYSGPLILNSSDTLTYDVQNRLVEHLFYVPTQTSRILYSYNSLNEDTIQLTQVKDSLGNWNNTEKTQRYFDSNHLINTDTVYTWSSSTWIYQMNHYFYFNGDALMDSLVAYHATKEEYDYYSSGLLYHKYSLQWMGSNWQYNSQETFYYDQYGNILHDAMRIAIYDSLGNVSFDFAPGDDNEVYDQYGNLLSYSGHGNPGGPYDGYYTYTPDGIPLSGYTFYSTMGGITTTRYINYYYAELFGDTSICSGNSTILSVDSCAGNSYLWSNGATSASIEVNSGDYSAVIIHPNGTSVSTPTVHIIISSVLPYIPNGADSTTSICGSYSLQLHAPPQANTVYQWYRNDSILSASTSPGLSMYGGVIEGDYFLIASNGCGSDTSATTTVHINPLPAAPTITSSTGSFTFCAGDSITLMASPGLSYLWLPGDQTTSSINVGSSAYITLREFDANGCYAQSQIHTQVQSYPYSPTLFLANGAISMNTSALQYQWLLNGDTIPGATASTYVPQAGGYYSLILQNYAPCYLITDSIYINSGGMTVDAGPDRHVCMNGGVTFYYSNPVVGGTAPYTFSWSPGVINTGNGSGYMSNITTSQTCFLTVTDALGNTASDSVRIYIENPIIPQISLSGINCDDDYLAARISSQVFPGSLQHWILNGDTLGNSQPLMIYGSGTLSATYIDQNGCRVSTETDTLEFLPRTSLHLNGTLDSSACINGFGTFWVDAVAGASYAWRQSGVIVSNDTIFSTTYPDNYYVYQTDSNGCETSLYFGFDSFNSEFNFNMAMENYHSCDSVILIAPQITNATYAWAMNGTTLSETTNTLLTNSLGDYACTFEAPVGCIGNGSLWMGNYGSIPVNIVLSGNALHFDGNGTGYLYFQWFLNGQEIPGAVQSSYTPLVPGDYSLRIYTTFQCYCWSNTYHYQVCSVDVISVSSLVCEGECTGELTASGTGTSPLQYSWSNGSTNQTITQLCDGVYIVTMTDSLGCTAIDSMRVETDTVSFTTVVTHTTCIGCNDGIIDAIFTDGVTPVLFTLTPPGVTDPGGHFPNLPPGIYNICMQDALGCITCVDDTIFEDPTFVQTINNSIASVSPNPTTTNLTLQVPQGAIGKIFTVTDILRKEIYCGRLTGIRQTISTSDLTPGVYFITFPGEKLKTIRFVKD